MDIKISIIIPAYNVIHDIGRCLESVVHQTYRNLEIIVIDDGSTDGTGMIIDEWCEKDTRIRAIHKKNEGVTCARIAGIREASGDFIGFVDSDDVIEPQMYEMLLNNAIAYEADISHCGHQMIYPDGRKEYYYNTGELIIQDHEKGLVDLLEGKQIEPGLCNKLYKKYMVDEVIREGMVDLNIRINEDLLMNFYLFKQAERSVYQDICPYHYILRGGSATKGRMNKNKLKDPLKVMEFIQRDAKDLPILKEQIEERILRLMIYSAIMPLNDQKQLIRPYRQEIRKRLRRDLFYYLKQKGLSKKIRIMALWTAIWPASYRWIHHFYEKKHGLEKKYIVD